MNRDLFLAILALDSYNRGYGQRLKIDGESNQLGEATIVRDSAILLDGQSRLDIAADFYAVAYEWEGETIISYRGTDNPFEDANTG